jgi:hypothetical protein
MWFGSGFNSWYVGTIKRITPSRNLPILATFEDGDADLSLDPALYGVTGGREWALLLPPAPAASLPQAAARTTAAAGSRSAARPPLMPQQSLICGSSGSAAAPLHVNDSDDDEI